MHCCFIVSKNLKKNIYWDVCYYISKIKDRKRERQTNRKNPEKERKIDTHRETDRQTETKRETERMICIKNEQYSKI